MALRPIAIYPGQVALDGAYPHGKAQNDEVEGDGIGTPFEAQLVNELFGMQQELLSEAGITPNDVPEQVGASQYVEAIKVLGGERLVTHKALQEWNGEEISPPFPEGMVGQRNYKYLIAPKRSTLWFGDQSALVAIGRYTLDANDRALYLRSQDGTRWDDVDEGIDFDDISSNPAPNPICAAEGAPAEILIGSDTGSGCVAIRAGSFGSYSHNISALSGSPPCFSIGALHYAGFLGKYFAVNCDGKTIESSGNFTVWTPSAAICDSALATSTYGSPGGKFADDGTANVIFCASSTISGITRFRVWQSTDGTTWTVRLTGDSGLTGMDIAWHAKEQCFIALASNGKLYKSATGAVWALFIITPITAANSAVARHGTMAVAGNCIAKILDYDALSDRRYTAIAYSLDFGRNWYVTGVGKGFGPTTTNADIRPDPFTSLIAANGRLFVADGKYVYRSGLADAPTPLFAL